MPDCLSVQCLIVCQFNAWLSVSSMPDCLSVQCLIVYQFNAWLSISSMPDCLSVQCQIVHQFNAWLPISSMADSCLLFLLGSTEWRTVPQHHHDEMLLWRDPIMHNGLLSVSVLQVAFSSAAGLQGWDGNNWLQQFNNNCRLILPQETLLPNWLQL